MAGNRGRCWSFDGIVRPTDVATFQIDKLIWFELLH